MFERHACSIECLYRHAWSFECLYRHACSFESLYQHACSFECHVPWCHVHMVGSWIWSDIIIHLGKQLSQPCYSFFVPEWLWAGTFHISDNICLHIVARTLSLPWIHNREAVGGFTSIRILATPLHGDGHKWALSQYRDWLIGYPIIFPMFLIYQYWRHFWFKLTIFDKFCFWNVKMLLF